MNRNISLIVVFVHVALLLFVALHDAFTRPELRRKPIAVRHVKPAPIAAQAPAQKQVASKPAPVRKEAKPQPAKPAQKPARQANPEPEMLASIAKRLRDLESTPQSTRKEWSIPSKIDLPAPVAAIEPDSSASSLSYGDALTAFLEEVLEFPEQGEVRASLTVDPSGKLLRVQVLEARSEKNREYLKNRLPELEYPCFNERTAKSREFTITFRNQDRR